MVDLSKPSMPPPPPPGGPGRSGGRAGLVVGALLALIVVLVVTAGVLSWRLLTGSSSDESAPPAASSAPATRARSDPPSPSVSAASPTAQGNGPWQTVTSKKDAMAYDVPSDWRASPDSLAGYESKKQIEALAHVVAFQGEDWCGSGSNHTLVGFVTPGSISDKGTPAATAAHWAEWAGADEDDHTPKATAGTPRPVTVGRGKIAATEVTATVRSLSHKCPVPSIEATVVSVPKAGGGQALLVVVADRDMADAVPDATLAKVIASVRPTR